MSDREVIEHWKAFHRDLCRVLQCEPTVPSDLIIRVKQMKTRLAKSQSESQQLKKRIRQLGKVISQASAIVKKLPIEDGDK